MGSLNADVSRGFAMWLNPPRIIKLESHLESLPQSTFYLKHDEIRFYGEELQTTPQPIQVMD